MTIRRDDDPVCFHRLTDEYGCFTNFARYPIILHGHIWPTSEHYFQAQKYTDPTSQGEIRSASTPSAAAKLGQRRTIPIRADWDHIKIDIMRAAVRAKFIQHPTLRRKLRETGRRVLIEDTARDFFWGAGFDHSGRNINGRILMELRDHLATPEEFSSLLPNLEEAQVNGFANVLFSNRILVKLTHRHREPIGLAAAKALSAVRSPHAPNFRLGAHRTVGGIVYVPNTLPELSDRLPDIFWAEEAGG